MTADGAGTSDHIEAEEFWHFYSRNGFAALSRGDQGYYHGTKIDHDASDGLIADMIDFSISRESMAQYPYGDDERFICQVSLSSSQALAAVVNSARFTRETTPNHARLALISRILRNDDLDTPEERFDPFRETSRIVNHVHQRELSRGEAIDRLKPLAWGRGESFEAFSRAVLTHLLNDDLDSRQAEHLLTTATPSTNVVPYDDLRKLTLETLGETELQTETICHYLEALLPDEEDYSRLQASGEISAVKTERDVLLPALARCTPNADVIEQFTRILDNHENEDLFLVMEAVRSLGLCNHKGAIEVLLDRLARADMERYWSDIEEALQRLCSAEKLIPKLAFGFDIEALSESDIAAMEAKGEEQLRLEHDYWKRIVSGLPTAPDDWLERDARSVFWEKRLRCALDPETPDEILEELRGDEVAPVRQAALSRA